MYKTASSASPSRPHAAAVSPPLVPVRLMSPAPLMLMPAPPLLCPLLLLPLALLSWRGLASAGHGAEG